MNIVLVLFCCLSLPITDITSERSGVSVSTYIKNYKAIAIKEMQRLKIPASITLAQGILESNLGKSYLAKKANNHFGIKCHSWQGERTYAFDDGRQSCFRNYRTAKDSFIDHSNFLAKNSRYRSLFKSSDYKLWAKGLAKAGYATDPHYASKLIKVIKRFKLYHYDKLKLSKKIKATLSKQNGIKVVQFNQDMTLKRIAAYYKMDLNRLAFYNDLDPQTNIKANIAIYLQNPHPTGKTYKQQIHSVASMYGIKSLSLPNRSKKTDKQGRQTPIQVKSPSYLATPAIVAAPNIRTWNKDTKVNYAKTIWGTTKTNRKKQPTKKTKKIGQLFAKTPVSPQKKVVVNSPVTPPKQTVNVPSPKAKAEKMAIVVTSKTSHVTAASTLNTKQSAEANYQKVSKATTSTATEKGLTLNNKIKTLIHEANNVTTIEHQATQVAPKWQHNQDNDTESQAALVQSELENSTILPTAAATTTTTKAIWHTVKQTETLYSLSWKYNTTIDDILKHNQLIDYAIEVGQQLMIIENSVDN